MLAWILNANRSDFSKETSTLGMEEQMSFSSTCWACPKPWVRSPTLHKLSGAQASDLSTLYVDVKGSEVQGHFWLYNKFECNLDCIRPYLKKGKKKEMKTKRKYKHNLLQWIGFLAPIILSKDKSRYE